MATESLRKILIYGAGNVGCYLGGRLAGAAESAPMDARPSVRYLVRPHRLAALREHGISLSDGNGYSRQLAGATLDLQTEPAAALANIDLVLVTVKSAATAEVATELAKHLPTKAVVISFQNGLHNVGPLRAALPGHTVLAGMVPFNIVQPTPDAFHQATSGHLMVEASRWSRCLLDLFTHAGLPLLDHSDMPAVQRAKLLLNLNNAINALSDLPLRDELAQRTWRRCLALAQREALQVFAAASLPLAKITPLPPHWLPQVLELPDLPFRLIASRMLAIDPQARSSMWEDLRAGRRSEVDALQGEIVALAAAHGMAAPVNARLLERIREAERQHQPFTGEALLADLRAATAGQRA